MRFSIFKFQLLISLILIFNSIFSQNFKDSLILARERTKEFLVAKINSDSCTPEVLLFLPWFQKESCYEVVPSKKLTKILELKKKSDPIYVLYARFFEKVTIKPDFSRSLDSLTLECLYWDFEKKNIQNIISQMNIDSKTKKGYDLTHLILRWYILKAQNCPYLHLNLISGLYNDWLQELPKVQSPDLLAEMLAMASFTGWEIPENEVRRLITMQNTDGGFPWVKIGLISETHSSFLAIWAFSTYIQPKSYNFSFSN